MLLFPSSRSKPCLCIFQLSDLCHFINLYFMFMSYIDFKPAYTFYSKLSQPTDLRNMLSRETWATSSLPEIEL